MSAGVAVLFTVVLLLVLGVWALVRRLGEAREMFDTLTADETAHEVQLADGPTLVVLPAGFTCLRCGENPALPAPSVWCAVCAPIVDKHPAEPIERGAL